MSLLLASLLGSHIPMFKICGIDISPTAIELAKKNLKHNVALQRFSLGERQEDIAWFTIDNVFEPTSAEDSRGNWVDMKWDILVSNPPYVSPTGFHQTTSRGVRNWEPKEALVPLKAVACASDGDGVADERVGDAFYPSLLDIAEQVKAKVVLFEVADMEQAKRVAGMVIGRGVWDDCEIWRDWPDQGVLDSQEVMISGRQPGLDQDGSGTGGALHDVWVNGEGNGRAILAWRGEGGKMLGKS